MKKTLTIAGTAALIAVFFLYSPQAKAGGMVMERDNTAVCVKADYTKTNRPVLSERLFTSEAIEKEIIQIKKQLTNPKLAWMFENCFPNTLDTTVHYRAIEGDDDT